MTPAENERRTHLITMSLHKPPLTTAGTEELDRLQAQGDADLARELQPQIDALRKLLPVPPIVPVSREQFMANAPFTGEDRFCKAYHSKTDMMSAWDKTWGIFIEVECKTCQGAGAVINKNRDSTDISFVRCADNCSQGSFRKLAAAVTMTISKREPKTANLQLIHTFSGFRRRGYAKALMESCLQSAYSLGCEYFRVSAEPESVAFYEALRYKFLGRQKGGCFLCMFKVGGPTVQDAIWVRDDHVRKAIDSKRKGGVAEEFDEEGKPKKMDMTNEVSKAAEDIFPNTGGPVPAPKKAETFGVIGETVLPSGFTRTMKVEGTEEHGFTAHVKYEKASEDGSIEGILRRIVREEINRVLKTVGTMLAFGASPERALGETRCPSGTWAVPAASAGPVAPAPPATAPAAPQPAPKPKREKPPRAPRISVAFLDEERMTRLEEFRKSREGQPANTSPRAINIRGTNGSGKTHIVRAMLDEAKASGMLEPVPGEDGKHPAGYLIKSVIGTVPDVFVLGQYETACGGADSISGEGALDAIYDIVERQVTEHGRHVIAEGLICCSDFRRTCDLHSQGFPIEILMLDTSLEQCIINVNKRRADRDKGELPNTGNLEAKYHGNLRSIARFQSAGVPIQHVSVEEAQKIIKERFS